MREDWKDGILGYRNNGMMEYCNDRKMEGWNGGILDSVFRRCGIGDFF
jgi:hypothetical protein